MTEKTLIANGLSLCYEEFGKNSDPAILLVMGLGTQMIAWPDAFCQGLANLGFRVIRFDNRDIGLSQKMYHSPKPNIVKITILAKLGLPFKVAYQLSDMASDAIGVLNALDIDKAHIAGVSMGGMISQILAAQAPERVLSLTSIMSTSGRRHIPSARPEILKEMLKPAGTEETSAVAQRMKVLRLIGSVGQYQSSDEEIREKVLRSYRRSVYPAGYLRHMAAIAHCGSREKYLRKISAPTVVIHGKADPLVSVEGGIDTARLIQGSKLQLIDDMGHDLPSKLVPTLVEMIANHARDSQSTSNSKAA